MKSINRLAVLMFFCGVGLAGASAASAQEDAYGDFLDQQYRDADRGDLDDPILRVPTGPYVAGIFGRTFEYNVDSNDIIATSNELNFDYEEGYAFSGAIGMYLGNHARIEFETSFHERDYESINFLSIPIGIEGDLAYTDFLANLYFDIPLWTPQLNLYVGGGIGLALVRSDASIDSALINVAVIDGLTTTTAITEIDDSYSTLVYQFMAGLSYRVASNVTLTGGYRVRLYNESGNDGELSGLTFREHNIQGVEVGLRIDF
jgi:opacity protein-like surface antigen